MTIIKKPAAVDSPYPGTPTNSTVTHNTKTSAVTSTTDFVPATPTGGSALISEVDTNTSIYATGVAGVNSLVDRGVAFRGANIYLTLEEQTYVTNNTISTAVPGNGTPGGSNNQVQFNLDGNFAGDARLSYYPQTHELVIDGNVYANYVYGNGSQLTGIVATTTYNDSNVVALLADFGSNTIATTGNVTAGNLLTGEQVIANGEIQSGTGFFTGGYLSVNGSTDLHDTTVTGNLSATGDVGANAFIGDGSQLTNIPAAGTSGDVQVNWQGSFSNQGGTPGDTYSTLQFDSNGMPTLDGTTAYQQRVDYSPYLQVLAPRVESTDFGIVAGPAIQITGYADDVFYNTPRSAYLSVQDQATATQQWDFGILGNGSNNYSISDRTNSNQWMFGTDGNITLPADGGTGAATVSINFAGVGYTTETDVPTAALTGTGSGMTVDIVASTSGSNPITSVTINQAGTGYAPGDSIQVAQPSSTGNGTLTVDSITPVTIPSINYANGDPYGGGGSIGNLAVIGTTIVIDADAPETSIYISPSGEGYAYLALPNNATANTVDTHLWNAAGNVEIGAGDASNFGPTYTWLFGADGMLTLPKGGVLSEGTSPSGLGNTIAITPSGGSDADQQLLIYPTGNVIVDGNHLHLTTGNLFNTELYLGNDDFYVKLANTGNIIVNTAGNTAQWTFGTDGRLVNLDGLTLTAGGQFNICTILTGGSGYNTGSALKATTGGSGTGMTVGIGYGLSNQLASVSVVNPGAGYVDGDVITVSEGTGGTFVITRYNDQANQANNNFVESNWTFDAAGGTVFPTLTTQRGDNPSGTITGQTLLFGDAAQEAIISTADGTVSNENSQRLVINPGQGYDYGEGGDIYLWAGRGGPTNGSGGDIKIRGGQGMANGTGGYIRIEGGDTQGAGYPGYIDITGGRGGATQGAYVRITGGQGATNGGEAGVIGGYGTDVGGDANITAGYGGTNQGGNVNITGGGSALGLPGYGNVNISAGASQWVFDNTGNLTIPGNILGSGNILIAPDSASASSYLDIYLTGGPDIHIASNDNSIVIGRDTGANIFVGNDGEVSIRTDDGTTAQVWNFDDTGNLSAPGNISAVGNIAGAYIKGNGSELTNLPAPAVAQDITSNGAMSIMTYDGNLKYTSYATVEPSSGNIAGGNISTTGNITGGNILTNNYFYANGSPFVSSNYGNANVAANLAAFGNNPISTTGNITAGNFIGNGAALTNVTVNVAGNIVGTQSNVSLVAGSYTTTFDNTGNTAFANGTVSVTTLTASGNITGNYILGNGSQLTGIAASYGNANVVANLAALGSNPVNTTGNVTGGNLITAGVVSASGNVSGNYILGNGALLTGVITSVANINSGTSNVTVVSSGGNVSVGVGGTPNVAVFASTGEYITGVLSVTGNITGGNIATAGQVSATGNVTTANSFVGNLVGTSVSVTGNVSAGNVIVNGQPTTYGVANLTTGVVAIQATASGTVAATVVANTSPVSGTNFNGGSNASPALTVLTLAIPTAGTWRLDAEMRVYIPGEGYMAAAFYNNGTLIPGSEYFIAAGGVTQTGAATGQYGGFMSYNLTTTGATTVTMGAWATGTSQFITSGDGRTWARATQIDSIFALNTLGTMSLTGNITTTGNVLATGNVTAANFFGNGNTLSNVATRFESAWTVPTGTSTQSFTVAANETYYMWVDCNIPNGILTWNATATVTNTNVPVVGAQYAWVYNGGGTPIDFTSIPNQFIGTSNTIVRSSVAPSATTNRFDFGLNNTSGGNVTVRYGWITIS